jgi:hypothetical protein
MIRELERNEAERTKWLELREERVEERVRWGIRAAQWRALELAREVFGESAAIRLDAFPPRGAFRALVHLRVPFEDLDDHRERETIFGALAGHDELLRRVPLVFVFEPDPAGRPASGPVFGAAGP